MSFTPGFKGTATNGVTPVTVVAAPGERTQRIVRSLVINNKDSASIVATVKHVTSGGSSFTISSETITTLSTFTINNIVLDDPLQTITVELAGAVSATEPDCTAHYADLAP